MQLVLLKWYKEYLIQFNVILLQKKPDIDCINIFLVHFKSKKNVYNTLLILLFEKKPDSDIQTENQSKAQHHNECSCLMLSKIGKLSKPSKYVEFI